MSKKSKGSKIIVKLRNPETGTFYTTYRNTKSQNTQEKLKFRKYDPKTRKHEEFVENKI